MSRLLPNKLLAGLFIALGLGAAASPASAYSDIYVFGDSLSDSGNIFAATSGAFPPPPYYNGRFSNGPTYVDNLAGMLGFSLTPSLLGGQNYAFGGATAAAGSSVGPLATDLGAQVNSFRALSGSADANALYVVWAGGNDLRAATPPTAAAVIGAALTGVQNAITDLYTEGARNFLVMNMPDLGLTPEAISGGPAAVGGATFLSATFNSSFASVINGLRLGLAGEDIRTLDTFSLLNTVVANPGAYGFNNTTGSCIDAGPACTPDSWLFWDGIHPTAAGHRLIADAAFGVVSAPVPEPETYAMMLAGLGLLGLIARRRKRQAA